MQVFVRLAEPAVAELNAQSLSTTGAYASPAEQRAQAKRVSDEQVRFRPALEGLGAKILAAQRVGANGFRVKVRASDVATLRAMPGVRVWSAGHDVHELPTGGRDPLGYQDPLDRVLRCVQDCPVPVIAMVEGSVWGGAFDLCVSCDMIVCGEDTTFALTPAKLGVPYSASGLIRFLNVLGPQKAKELLFTAKPISAETALQARMVNHVVPREELEPVTYGIAETIARNAPLAVQAIKQQFRLLLQSQTLAPETFERIQGIRRVVYDSQDYQEGIQAFKEKRKPEFHGR
jgi:methylmalonyl-CoA decarboxylase